MLNLVSFVGFADQARALLRALRDDTGFQLITAIIERFDATRHRVFDRNRIIDGKHDSHSRDPCKDRTDDDNIEAEQRRAGWWVQHDFRIPCLDFEADHFGHDKCANRHPDHATQAGNDQAIVGEKAAEILRVDPPDHEEDDERQ